MQRLLELRNGTVHYVYTKREFGHSRCLVPVNNSRGLAGIKAQTVISRSRFEPFRRAGHFYRPGDHVRVVWVP